MAALVQSLPESREAPRPAARPPAEAAEAAGCDGGARSARLALAPVRPFPAGAVRRRLPAREIFVTSTASTLAALTDEQLVERARDAGPGERAVVLEALFRRHHPRVAAWCLRLAGDRDRAADLAQEVFLRAQSRLDTFRADSRFSTWLYTVARSVAINRGVSERRRATDSLDAEGAPDPVDPAPDAETLAALSQDASRLRRALVEAVEPLEARVLVLHFVHGMTLEGIDRLLGLTNRSGARAYLIGAKRKLRRYFDGGRGRRLAGAGGMP